MLIDYHKRGVESYVTKFKLPVAVVNNGINLLVAVVVAQGVWHRRSILASHPAAPGSNPSTAEIFSLYCLVGGQY